VALQLRSGDPSADEGKSWRNLDEYTALVRAALASYHGGIVVEVVSDTLDFAGWLKPCTNKNLALFSRHGPENFHPGMHVVRFEAHDVALLRDLCDVPFLCALSDACALKQRW
jgi:hypothetical protein